MGSTPEPQQVPGLSGHCRGCLGRLGEQVPGCLGWVPGPPPCSCQPGAWRPVPSFPPPPPPPAGSPQQVSFLADCVLQVGVTASPCGAVRANAQGLGQLRAYSVLSPSLVPQILGVDRGGPRLSLQPNSSAPRVLQEGLAPGRAPSERAERRAARPSTETHGNTDSSWAPCRLVTGTVLSSCGCRDGGPPLRATLWGWPAAPQLRSAGLRSSSTPETPGTLRANEGPASVEPPARAASCRWRRAPPFLPRT